MEEYNIILDTNALRYFTNIENGNSERLSIENHPVDNTVFYNLCRNANCLFVTGQSLYEIFWQSIEQTYDIDFFAPIYNFIAKYRRIYNKQFTILNDADGMFDLDLFEKQFKDNNVDIEYFVEEKRKYECTNLTWMIYSLYYSVMGVILDCYNSNFVDEYIRLIHENIRKEIEEKSKAFYSAPGYKNSDFDKFIDNLLGYVWKTGMEMLREGGIAIPEVKYNGSGSEYIRKLFLKLKKEFDDIYIRYEAYWGEISDRLKKRGVHEENILFLKRLCYRCIRMGAKVRKNDGIDYSIISCLAKDTIINETGHNIDFDNTFFLTFDSNLYNFSKENGVLYNKKVYDKLLNNQ